MAIEPAVDTTEESPQAGILKSMEEFNLREKTGGGEVPEDRPASQEDLLASMEAFKKGQVQGAEKPGLTSNSALDILESAKLRFKQAFNLTGMDPDPAEQEDKVALDVIDAENGQDIREKNYPIFAEEYEEQKDSRVQGTLNVLMSPTSTEEEKLRSVRALKTAIEVDSLFTSVRTANASFNLRELEKRMLGFLADPTANPLKEGDEAEIKNLATDLGIAQLADSVMPRSKDIRRKDTLAERVVKEKLDINKWGSKEVKQYGKAFLDEFMYQTMFIPEWVHGLVDKDTKDAMVAFRALLDENQKKGGIISAVAGKTAEQLSLVLDPVVDTGLAIPIKLLKGVRAAGKVKSLMKTTEVLDEFVGTMPTLALSKASHETRVVTLNTLKNTDHKAFEAVEKIVAQGTDDFSQSLGVAIKEVREGKAVVGTPPELMTSAGSDRAIRAGLDGDQGAIEELVVETLLATDPRDISRQVDVVRRSIDAGDHVTLTMIPDLPHSGVLNPTTEFGRELNNATSVSTTVANRIEWDYMQGPVEAMVAKTNHASFYNRQISIGPSAQGWAEKSGSRILGFTFAPRATFKGSAKSDLVLKVLLNTKEEQRLAQAADRNLKRIFKNVKGEEKKLMNQLLLEGNDVGRNWMPVEGGLILDGVQDSFQAASPKVVDSMMGFRRMHDDAAVLLNSTMRSQMKTKGYKFVTESEEVAFKQVGVAEGTPIVDRHGNSAVWSREHRDAGDSIWTFSKKGERGTDAELVVLSEKETREYLGEIPDAFNPLNNRDGYMHIKYTEPYVITKLQLDESGNIVGTKAVATADSTREAQEFISKFEDVDGGTMYTADRVDGPRTDVVTGDLFDRSFKMTDAQFKDLEKILRDGGKSEEFIQALKDSRQRYGYRPQGFMKHRGEGLLSAKTANFDEVTGQIVGEKAPILASDEAAASYLAKVSRYTANAPWEEMLKTSFQRNYGKLLSNPDDIFSFPKGPAEIGIKKFNEVSLYQRQLKNITGKKGLTETYVDASRQWAISKVTESTSPVISHAGEILHKIVPNVGQFTGTAKTITRQSLMGIGAVIQTPMQFANAYKNALLIAAGGKLLKGDLKIAAKIIARTHTDFASALVPLVTNAEVGFTKRGKLVWERLQKSGITAGIDLEAFGGAFRDPRNMNVLTTGWAKKTIKGAAKVTGDFALYGEQGAQMFGWLAAHNEIEGLIKAGKYPTLGLDDLAKNSDRFIDAVTQRGSLFSHNMSRANRAGMSSGEFLSMATMLKRFGFDEAGLYYNMGKELTRGEQVALWAGTVGAFGLPGVPGYMDAVMVSETAGNLLFPGIPDKDGVVQYELPLALAKIAQESADKLGLPAPEVKTMFLALTQGGISAATKGQLALAPRMAVAGLYTPFIRGASMDENTLGASWSVFKKYMEAGKVSSEVLYNAIREYGISGIPVNTYQTIAGELTDPVTGIAKMKQAYGALTTGEIRSSTGQLLREEESFADILLLSLGETPGDIRMLQEYQSVLFKRKTKVKDWIRKNTKAVAELYQSSPEHAAIYTDHIQQELTASGYGQLAVSFQMMAIRETMKKDLPATQKAILDSVIDPIIEENLRDVLGIIQK